MKRKGFGCMAVIGCIIVTIIINRFTAKERVYYIPDRELYIMVSVVPKDDYGYIFFGKDNIDVFKKKDYLKLHKVVDNIIINIYLKADGDTIYYIPLSKALEVKQTNFVFVEKERFDSTMFDYDCTLPVRYKRKPEYIKTITLYDFNTNIHVSRDSSGFMSELEPLNK